MVIEGIDYASLSNELSSVSDNILAIVNKIDTTGKYDNIFWQKINKDIEKQYEKLRKVTAKWVESNIPQAYQELLNEQLTLIKYQDLPKLSQYQYGAFVNSNLPTQSINTLINDTLQTYYKGFLNGEKTLKKLANYTQIVNMQENKISDLIAQGIMEKGNAQYSYKLLRDKMREYAKDEKFITIINKNGKEIHYNLEAYAELVTRTKLQDANAQAVLDTAKGIDSDLVQYSMHNSKCKICAPLEGRIFSLSGKDKDFPKIETLPANHPNCRHSITIVFKDALRIEGSLDKYIAFSNGEIDRPPNNSAFIPINKRDYSRQPKTSRYTKKEKSESKTKEKTVIKKVSKSEKQTIHKIKEKQPKSQTIAPAEQEPRFGTMEYWQNRIDKIKQ